MNKISICGFLLAFLGAVFVAKGQTVVADKVFYNGIVLTVDSKNSIAQALALKEGKILAVGSSASIFKLRGKNTKTIDLKGKTITPGFVDGHSHFLGLGQQDLVNVSAPPVGKVTNISQLIAELEKFKQERQLKEGEWITAYGYDIDQLKEKRHPIKEDLDVAFPRHPVVVAHISGHMLVANSLALKLAGIDQNTKDPAGGVIIRKEGTTEPAGLLQENAQGLILKELGKIKPTLAQQLERVDRQQKLYASYGVTTAQDGFTDKATLTILQAAAEQKKLLIDVISLPSFLLLDDLIADTLNYKFKQYHNRLKIDGIKLSADGSPQGKTAYFTKPYLTLVPGCSEHCTGVPTVTSEIFNSVVLKAFSNNIHLYTHCNGDGAIDMYIAAVENANKVLNKSSVGRRSVVIHSQFVRQDQLDKYKQLDLLPSFFTNHAFFWGDVHKQNLGQERAYGLSPLRSAINKGIIFTNHTDYPVTPIDQLFLLWSAVNRLSRTGEVIGGAEKINPVQALRALTINGAYQYGEEKTKGSIEKGKLADLVILSANPLNVDPVKIKDIVVIETIKEGQTIYKKN
ncbi:amidohydrolase [Pedobacter sp. ASV28]|uniref:amidohydrolase n=1 Tax=Pedobacter sp. ASV28 TaxID=2795123 RepID=UPI0018EDA441|nr:amidohydrolase [Pedobacter sp. ASV28]